MKMLFFLHKLFQNLVTFIIRQKQLLILFCIKHNFKFVFLQIHIIQILFVRPISTSLRQCAYRISKGFAFKITLYTIYNLVVTNPLIKKNQSK